VGLVWKTWAPGLEREMKLKLKLLTFLENRYHFLVLKFRLVQVEVIGGNRRSLGQCMHCAYHEVNYKELNFQAEERRRKRKRNEN
jgi:hypothetical protein